ncbi:NADH-dependent flavin oxidoreductase [Limosilactobacillus sp. STM2_1]|uniref:NADH-dependent flavin oxidoreductase n=1 Tax=Limosilactobacillus rudii TaxID=2759755 RepID=A0A7W3UJA4_9LACO|nr:NADH-dependent flavin oxidoreductase [Limosilactobacillus rudii]MBB1078462.1 NADH-dependent flavin oxidoreductase [Limosilactobacillus rudii]MBB1096592.1 NADH-dependent flavin oxidoreductase [Limosilactobacillus rudii]MCD7134212.1 NADH-dependent flavin oxidoreductase [Limosilactobacillus rudii]
MTNRYEFMKPYKFANGLKLQNKIVMAPVTLQSSFFDGAVSDDEVKFYRMRSGVGMIIVEVANINEAGKGFEGELSVADDRFIPGLGKIANAIHSKGSKAVLQIFDAGRKTSRKILRGVQPRSASAVAPHRDLKNVPRELTDTEIEQVIADFGAATLRAIRAGFDGVEIHGANTYLIQQFFSPHSNHRRDRWGGNVYQRMNFAKAVIAEVRRVANENAPSSFLVGYRFSPEELSKPGITIADTLKLVDVLSDEPIDYLHSSMGNRKRTSLVDKSNLETLNSRILKTINNRKPLIEVGNILSPQDADEALHEGASLVAMGRELIREPNWIAKVKTHDEKSIRYTLSPVDMDLLGLPGGLQQELRTGFLNAMNFTDQETSDFLDKFGQMEGFGG